MGIEIIEMEELTNCPGDYSRFGKAQLGHKNDVVLKTQEMAQITWKKQSSFSTTYHLLDCIWAAKHPQHRATTSLLPQSWGQQGGHPALAQPPPGAIPQLHLLHCSSPSAGCAWQRRWLIKVTGWVSIERGACFSTGLSTSVSLWPYQLCATDSFRPDRWQSISGSPLSVTALRCLSMAGLIQVRACCEQRLTCKIMQGSFQVYSSQAQQNYRLHHTW